MSRSIWRRPLRVAVALSAVVALQPTIGGLALEPPAPPLLLDLPAPPAPAPDVTAQAWALVDARSGQLLDGRQVDEPRPVASTVKLLTALTVVERAGLDDRVVIPDAVNGVGGASTSVDPGETWTVADLLNALLVRSGNDAATALATHIGGSVEGFVDLMRQDATALGLEPSLVTPSGLDDDNRLTPRDLGTLARAVLATPSLAGIVAQPSVSLPDLGLVPSRNLLLDQYAGANGLKTGFTSASGYSVVGSATRDGRTLIAVVLGADAEQSRFDDAAALLDHGFAASDEVRVGRAARLRVGGRWIDVATDARWVTVAAGTQVAVEWELPRRTDLASDVVVRIPRVDAIRLPVITGSEPGPSGVAVWLRDRLHESLRTLAATGR